LALDAAYVDLGDNAFRASLFGANGCGLAESALYDERGMIGQATQSLAVRPR
jgi:hypothetical protein